jgi:hypothetical protein
MYGLIIAACKGQMLCQSTNDIEYEQFEKQVLNDRNKHEFKVCGD